MGDPEPSAPVNPSPLLRRRPAGTNRPISEMNPAEGVLALRDLLESFGWRPSPLTFSRLGVKLGRVARGRPYSRRYVASVYNGTVAAGQPLLAAIDLLKLWADSRETREAMRTVTVLVSVSDIDGALVDGEVRECADPVCLNRFVPNTPARRYCFACRPRIKKEG